ncbi:TRAP transporter small permease [Rhizobium sp. GN54]|uniref:TRAP transporter small permease n=1 Tax=Rhizobium sp. GN54 TaxID=2898150 RepID=UPI001E41DFCF|nr:TRAP transporter small permease [Rhizobium sp. GN54]MCD2184643.1 TRAP transporter small permease [Rhizobium sp. GN54]
MLSKFDRAFIWSNQFLIGALMLIMTVLVFANVVLRYVVGISLPWVEEISRYMMIWVAYLGAGLALRGGAHVAVEVLQDALPARLTRLLRIAIAVAILLFLGSVAWYGFAYAQFAMRQHSPVLNLPLGLVYMGVPIGCLVCAIHLVLGFRSYVERTPIELNAPDAHSDVSDFAALERNGA